MEVSRFLLVCGIGFLIAEGKPVDSPTKTLSLPLQRHWQPVRVALWEIKINISNLAVSQNCNTFRTNHIPRLARILR